MSSKSATLGQKLFHGRETNEAYIGFKMWSFTALCANDTTYHCQILLNMALQPKSILKKSVKYIDKKKSVYNLFISESLFNVNKTFYFNSYDFNIYLF